MTYIIIFLINEFYQQIQQSNCHSSFLLRIKLTDRLEIQFDNSYPAELLLQMMRVAKQSKISIIGAGISGISLAIMLHQKSYKHVQIFQKDSSFDSRKQGYGLTILQGKSALRRLGVLQQAKKHNSPTKAHYIFNNKGQILGFYGTLFWDYANGNRSLKSKSKGLSMHIPRQSLRKVLLDRAYQLHSPKIVKWSHALSKLDINQSSIIMHFLGENPLATDLLIGCDGVNSAVRKNVLMDNDKQLKYLNILIVLGICGSNHPLTKERVFQTADGCARLFSMPFLQNNPSLSSMWQLSMPMAQDRAQFYSHNPSQLKQYVLKLCQRWHDPIPSMIADTDILNIMGIPAYDREPYLLPQIDKRIIFAGDSGHPMCPFKGQGANQALLDSISLADMMQNTSIEQLNLKYQKEVLNRVHSKVILSRQRATKYHNPEFMKVQNFLYPRIDKSLIKLLSQKNINSQSGCNIEEKILDLMKQNGFLI